MFRLPLGLIALLAVAAAASAAPPGVQQQIDAAVAARASRMVVRPGTYMVAEAVHLRRLTNLIIDADGVTLLRADPTRPGLVLDGCRNVTVSGLTLRCQTPPFVQGRIVAIDPRGPTLDLDVDAGYRAEYLTRATTGYAFDAGTRRWKAGAYDYGTRGATLVPGGDGRRYRLRLEGRPGGTLAVGDDMAFRGPGAADVDLANCGGCQLEDVAVVNGSGFCFFDHGGEGGNRYGRCRVAYGPTPDGGTVPPHIAANADAFHCADDRRGPTLDGCDFAGMCDDGIAVHGTYADVATVTGAEVVVANRVFRPGDPYRALDAAGAEIGQGTVTAVAPADGFAAPPGHEKMFAHRPFVRLTLDPPVPGLGVACRLGNPAACGAGYVIRHCHVHDHRARGMLLKADDGLVEGNAVDGSTIAGLVISPEYYWNEAGYSRRVTVRDNVFRHCGYATATAGHPQAAAVCVTGEADHAGTGWGNRQIAFERNSVEDCDGCNLLINDAAGVTVTANAFVRPDRLPTDRGTAVGVDPTSLIVLEHCDDVRLTGNTVADPGPQLRHRVAVAPTATHVSGAVDGIVTRPSPATRGG